MEIDSYIALTLGFLFGQQSIEADIKGTASEGPGSADNYPSFTTNPTDDSSYATISLKLNESPTEKLKFLSMMMFLVGDGVSRFHTEATSVS